MDISIGADVVGTSGKLGEVHRVIVDARTDRVTDLVVRHGFAFGRERVVPLPHVTKVENGVVFLDLDEKGFEVMDGFADEHFHAPDPDYVGPPGFDRSDFLVTTAAAMGSAGGLGTGPNPSMGFPGGEPTSPDDMQRPALSSGTPVLDVSGEKLGEVHEFSLDPSSGAPTRLTVKSGFIFKRETEIPVSWIQDIGDDGVLLNVPKAEVEAHGQRA